ncbi:unnamed protein product [Cuscuta epithymum]|uniref:Mediator complex subunit 15 KIX domain-containing protein n=1 Tax=Cuscuta epithymum TaxID=186058 RepID=A0AAV0DG98_9ASTE|nr:unnamed protein product [Cuscuta epithymum]
MDANNWRAAQSLAQAQVGDATSITAGAAAPPPAASGAMETGDWRAQLQPESRHKIVNKIMDTLKQHLPFSGQEGLHELKKIAVRFEEKIHAAATDQSDYLRKISLKMISMETKSQNLTANPLQANAANSSQSAQGTGSQTMQPQAQPLPVPTVSNQSQGHQQLLSQNIQNTITSSGMQNSTNLVSALPTVGSLTQTNIPNALSRNSNLQSVQGIPTVVQSSVGNTMSHSNLVANSIRQMQERQQQVDSQQQQQSQASNTHPYQQQLRQQMLKQNIQSQVQQQQEQQQQPNLLQQTQMQSSQQGVMHSSTVQSNLTNLQQNQQSSVLQQSQSMIQQRSQSVLKQHQQQKTPIIHQQQGAMMQQPMLQGQLQQSQQQHLIGQQQNVANIQQNQPIGQQHMPDMQHQQTRLMGQQNNFSSVQQQQLINQQINIPSVHQQQIGTHGNVAGLTHQQLTGNQSSNSGLTANQHPIQMSQHSKVQVQQQMLPGATLSPVQGLQSQSQQQMLQQSQPQPGTLQSPLGLQQQTNTLQRGMQHRLQNPNPLLQHNLIDQQNQIFQPQRVTPDASSTSLDSTAQTGNTNLGDWREEAYQKLKTLKEMHFMNLNEVFQKICGKLAQYDYLPQQPKNEQVEKLKSYKAAAGYILQLLRLNKNDIQPHHKERLPNIESQIAFFLNPNRTRKPQPPQTFDGQINLRLQSLNLPGAMSSMQQSNLNSMQQHNPMSSVTAVSNSQQNMISTMQIGAGMDMVGQCSSLSSLQQVSSGALHQSSINGSQQMNLSSFSSQDGANSHQTNLQQNSKVLQHPRQHDQQMMQNQQLRQQMHQRQIEQQIFQKQLQQQQQIKQAQAPPAAQSMTQLHQMVDTTNDLKMRQQIGGMKSSVFQQHQPFGPRVALHHPQLKSTISSPQFHHTTSPQLSQHPSPQFDQQNALASHTKMGTPLHSASSPFAQSPSTPLAPSPMPGDFEKVSMGTPSLLGPGNLGIQQTTSASAQSLAIDTPGISTSPLLPEINSLDGAHANLSTSVSGKSTVEQPMGRLVNAVRTLSTKALSTSVSDISSVISMVDRVAGSAPGNGSRAAIGEDLVAMTKCRLHTRNLFTHDGPTGPKRKKCYTTSNVVSCSGSVNDGFELWNCSEASDLESTATSSIKKLKVDHALIKEITEINQRLIDTVVEISDEPSVLAADAAIDGGKGGTLVKCSFMAVSLSPKLKSQCALDQMSPIQSLRLLVPANYPNCSPIFVDSFPVEVSKEYENLSGVIRSRLSTSLRSLSQPMSLADIARAWDCCTRAAISDYAQRCGGGSFSSKYGTWEDCMTTAA